MLALRAECMYANVASEVVEGYYGVPGFATLTVPWRTTEEKSVFAVLDRSGSMGMKPFGAEVSAFTTLQQAMRQFVPKLLGCTFGAVSFNHEAKVLVFPTLLQDEEAITHVVSELDSKLTVASGETDLTKALEKTFAHLRVSSGIKRKADGNDEADDVHVFVLTDGKDPDLSLALQEKKVPILDKLFTRRRTTIHMVGVGPQISKDLNSLVMKATMRGTSSVIDTAEKIPLVLDNFVTYIKGNVSENLSLRVREGDCVVVDPIQLLLQVNVETSIPFLLPARPGKYIVEVLDADDVVLAAYTVDVNEAAEWSTRNEACVGPELSRLSAVALEEAGTLLQNDEERSSACARLQNAIDFMMAHYEAPADVQLQEMIAVVEAERTAHQRGEFVSDSLSAARMMSQAYTVRHASSSLTHWHPEGSL